MLGFLSGPQDSRVQDLRQSCDAYVNPDYAFAGPYDEGNCLSCPESSHQQPARTVNEVQNAAFSSSCANPATIH